MSFPSSVVDLEDKILGGSAHALNVDSSVAVTDFFSGSASGPITSDVDEQLLLTVPFSTHVKLRGLRVTVARPTEDDEESGDKGDVSAPKEIRIFVNQPNMGFEDVDVVKPAQVIQLTEDHLSGKPVDLKPLPFNNVLSLTLFVASNQGGTDKTAIGGIRFFGIAPAGTDMSKLEKCKGCC